MSSTATCRNKSSRGRSYRGRPLNGGRGRQTNFAGRGPKNFDTARSRPDSIIPTHHALDLLSDDDCNFDAHLLRQGSSSTRHVNCLVCYSSQLPSHRAIAPCGHDDICALCHLRLRYLHTDKKCPICKSDNETLIVDTDNSDLGVSDAEDGTIVHHKRYDQYNLWGEDLGAGFIHREDVGMHFPLKYHETVVLPLFGYACGIPRCDFVNDSEVYVAEREAWEPKETGGNCNGNRNPREVKKRLSNLEALHSHLRISHGMSLCDLCVTNKRDFVSRLPRFTVNGIKNHLTKGDGDQSGFTGHPLCEFCRPMRFYDIVKLHDHLNKDHYKCHICDKMGKPNQFFKDYQRLETHFDREHFLCHDAQCIAARFVVFGNEIDLYAHETSVHGALRRDGSTKIKLEFRVRRSENENLEQSVPTGEDFQYGLNGEAFVPDDLPGEQQELRQVNEPEITHPMHATRTAELRAMAARIREKEDRGITENSFPALNAGVISETAVSTGSNTTSLLVGWVSSGSQSAASRSQLKKMSVGTVTDEEFPSLCSSSNTLRSNRNSSGIGKNIITKKPSLTSGVNFSTITSRSVGVPSSKHPSLSKPVSTVSYSSSIPFARAADIAKDTIPSHDVSARSTSNDPVFKVSSTARAPDFSGCDFPPLDSRSFAVKAGMPSSNQNSYTAAEAYARKLNAMKGQGFSPSTSAFPSLFISSDFPPPPVATTKKPSTASAFAQRKPPPSLDNMSEFPPAAHTTTCKTLTALSKLPIDGIQSGKDTVEKLKNKLGPIQFKNLKAMTKSFANGSTPPEQYVNDVTTLFDQGLGDKDFWTYVPELVISCPNEIGVNQALKYIESLRLAYDLQTLEFNGVSNDLNQKRPQKNSVLSKNKQSSWISNK